MTTNAPQTPEQRPLDKTPVDMELHLYVCGAIQSQDHVG